MLSLSNPVPAITLFMFLYGIGRFIAKKTKGVCAEALFLSIVYAVGFITGIIPRDTLEVTGLPALMSAFGTMLLVTNLGTMIELRRFVKELRTVAICFGGLAVLVLAFFTIGQLLFGRYYALTAVAPVAGGLVATGLVNSAAEAAGHSDYAAFASLICSLQTFVGVPCSAYLMRRYCNKLVAGKQYQTENAAAANGFSFRLIKSMPAFMNDGSLMVARLLLVTLLSMWVATVSGGVLPAAVVALVLGIVATEIGFLETQTLTKAEYMSFLIMGLILVLLNGFRTLTAESFGAMLLPIVGLLVLGAIALSIGGVVIGKILRVDPCLAASVSLSAMFGYPLTQIIVDNVVDSYDIPAEEKQKLSDMVMPQMIIAGFTTVTIASVVLAGFIAPMIF